MLHVCECLHVFMRVCEFGGRSIERGTEAIGLWFDLRCLVSSVLSLFGL